MCAAATCALRRARCSAKQGRGGRGGEFTSLLPSSLPRTSLQTDQVGEELRGGKEVAKTCYAAKSGDDGRVSDKKNRWKKFGAVGCSSPNRYLVLWPTWNYSLLRETTKTKLKTELSLQMKMLDTSECQG